MTWIVHGTTLRRAERMALTGPDPNFRENPGSYLTAESFCAYLAAGPFELKSPQVYACNKAILFPAEGGAAIIEIDVPDEIIEKSLDDCEICSSRKYAMLQFDFGSGLEELRAGWRAFPKKVTVVDCP